jgi:hypothetical protein
MNPDRADSLWSSQSTLLWSKLQTISAIEVGTVIGAYNLWKSCENGWLILLLLTANWFLFLIWILMCRDRTYLDLFQKSASFKRPEGIFTGKLIANLVVWSSLILNTVFWIATMFRLICQLSSN